MTSHKQLRRSGGTGKPSAQSTAQKSFRSLVERIHETSAKLRAWEEALPPFRAAYVAKVQPLLAREREQVRAWVLALDRAAMGRTWSRKDARTLRQMLVERSQALLAEQPEDAEIAAVFKRHSGKRHETLRRQEAAQLQQTFEVMSGLDLGERAFATAEEVYERIEERLQQQAAEHREMDWEAAHAAAATAGERARAKAKEARRKADSARITQSLREIYRKLVSELHPDREPDEERRRVKTGLMQKVNEAYETKDLLTLLEVQLQLEQLDAGALDALDAATLKRYNSLLSQQVWGLEHELETTSRTFMQDYGLAISHRPDPERLDLVIERTCKHIRAATREWAAQAEMMRDAPSLRAWLEDIREEDRERDGDPWE